jgi:hypothetical protein
MLCCSLTVAHGVRAAGGVWVVRRTYTVNKRGTELHLQQEWLVLCESGETPGKGGSPLIAEVCTTMVQAMAAVNDLPQFSRHGSCA